MPTIGLFDAQRPAWAHRARRMEGFQDLQLGFLVGTDDTRPTRRGQVQAHDATDRGPKVGSGLCSHRRTRWGLRSA